MKPWRKSDAEMNQSELEKILKNVMTSKDFSNSYTPEQIEQIREIFMAMHRDNHSLIDDSWGLDELLGIDYSSDKNYSDLQLLRKFESKYGHENFWLNKGRYVQSYYSSIKYFFHQTKPRKDQVVYDLGSGFGRVVFYGGLVTDALIKGVEIVPERVQECNRIKEKLKLENISFTQANVLDVDISDGDIFFMYHPFSERTGKAVLEKLRKLSEQKPIHVGINLRVYGLDDNSDWLQQIRRRRDVRIFRSKQDNIIRRVLNYFHKGSKNGAEYE